MTVKFPWDLRTPWKLLTQQVGMKAQRIALRLERLARIFYADHLSGCQTDHRAFLVIVSLAAVNQVAVLFVFQKNHVKAERMPHVVHRFGLQKINHADQRMQSFYAEHVVVLRNGFDV